MDAAVDPAPETEASVTGAWLDLAMSMWRLAEILYGPCFSPVAARVICDGSGLMMGDAEAEPSEP